MFRDASFFIYEYGISRAAKIQTLLPDPERGFVLLTPSPAGVIYLTHGNLVINAVNEGGLAMVVEQLDIGFGCISPEGDMQLPRAYLEAEPQDVVSWSETIRLRLGFPDADLDEPAAFEFAPPLPKNLVPNIAVRLQALFGWEDGDVTDALTLAVETAIAREARLEAHQEENAVHFVLRLREWSGAVSVPREKLPTIDK